MNENKKLLKYFIIGCLSIIILYLTILFICFVISLGSTPEEVWHQYCLEDGDCKEGEVLNDDGKTIVITKEYCIKNNYKWHEDKKYCKLREP